MSNADQNYWHRRDFIKGIGATAAGMALSSCAISGDRSAKGLTEEAAAVEPVVNPKSLEKPNITVGYVPVNDCAPFAIAWKKGFFRKYGLNVKLNREASWATSRDGLIFGRLDASPVVSGAVTNARIGATVLKLEPTLPLVFICLNCWEKKVMAIALLISTTK
ncbi:hypothetical protein CEN49_10330 [Fischerella thermalis CCMEE 5273]|nr:hypothetical protein CEN49_10330 [Fischerella thermalis CCMEE 5273]PMB17012.1 hypothetical protein CEN48_00280 [Fischerella thermalis CCMEE 5282]PMB37011.1 hypothetical protein CEN43_01320 [Fischerella thermalis BR2B]